MDAPDGARNCCPLGEVATAIEFRLTNQNKPNNFIWGELKGGELEFIVENTPKDGTGCPGKWLFAKMMNHFGFSVFTIFSSWTYGDNLKSVNQLTAGGAMAIADAAKQTWTGRRAEERGYNQIEVVSASGTPGHYSKVRIRFKK